jgi:uncharacterized cupredoxin-like copper-binding protein|tara:strand:+ start:1141 stop:2715 length:1575 start_codon:yes stop_codon:yes gene_type:complete
MNAKKRYDELSSERTQFLDEARQASELTLPYLIRGHEEHYSGMKQLKTPWQSVGAKGVVTLASKLMLALLPPQTSFFKLQLDESELGQDFGPEIRSELDLSFAKVERTILESIAASDDRVAVHQALQHLVVGGNALIFMGREGLKVYPLNRFVVERDGNGNVLEIVTKERISKKLIEDELPKDIKYDSVVDDSGLGQEECDVYTHVKRENNRVVWHQEVHGKVLPKSVSKAPIDANPWLPLRFNVVDGEAYGRGRVGQFIGDLKSLEALSQALVEGSAAAAKVVFVVSPSSTTKPATLASAGNGAIVAGRPDDIGVIQVGKTADFSTAFQMAQVYERRLSEAFLILNPRNAERVTAEEVRMTQLELEQQLGGLFSLLTTEFLVPYLNRKMSVAQKTGDIPRIPKGIVKPTIVAGINSLGRGQDAMSLAQFLQTIAQTMGPEAIAQYINPTEVVKRLAAAQGIDVLNLVKSVQELQGEQQAAQQMQQQQMAVEQQTAMMKTPMMDPTKNPELAAGLQAQAEQLQQ